MPKTVSHLRVVLASPSDVAGERKALSVLVERINIDTGRAAGIELELWKWETDARPGFHPMGPQGLIDEVLRIEECDLFIGIFWNRLGTPTPDGKTGTEHEFHNAYVAWQKRRRPEILFYFNDKPSNLTSKSDLKQRGKVIDFRNSFPEDGLYWRYSGKAQFTKYANDHLRKYIQQQISAKTKPAGKNSKPAAKKRGAKVHVQFPIKIGKGGIAKFPADMMNLLGLNQGDSLNFTVSNHQIASVSPMVPPPLCS
jgi:hypothetical protein